MNRRAIAAPLGINAARIISEADIVPNRSAGYRLLDGALHLTVLDMAKATWDTCGLARPPQRLPYHALRYTMIR
jgi:hypothetical protein